jgi:polyhydroxybutyrate depolymerase
VRVLAVAFACALLVALSNCSRRPKPDGARPSVAPVPSAAAGKVIDGTLRTADGRERRYSVYTPKGHLAGPPRPLVLVLHGGGGTAEGAARTSFTHAAADKHGIIAVYPEGIVKRVLGKAMATWNCGYCCGEAAKQGVDDSAFLIALLDHLKGTVSYDPKRVYATGISNGAIMATRLACEHADRIAAISVVANPGYVSDCKNPRPVAVQIIHGTADGCAEFDGGTSCGGCWERAAEKWLGIPLPARSFPCTSVADQSAFWRKVNGCGDVARTTYEHGKARCAEYAECSSHESVSVCVIDGGGHTWPGGDLGCDPTKKACGSFQDVTGPISHDLDANDTMAAFFARVALP